MISGNRCDLSRGRWRYGVDDVWGTFVALGTFTVNGMMFDCMAGLAGILPEARNGGWCFQASAGSSSYADFTTYNVR